jgi:hypothetical protein
MALKSFALSVLVLLTCVSCGSARHHQAANGSPERRVTTHEELAQRIVWMMGDELKLPAGATALDYERFLAGKGIAPLGGWRHGDAVTKGDLAVVTVRLLGLQRRVQDRDDEAAYIALLESIELQTIIE